MPRDKLAAEFLKGLLANPSILPQWRPISTVAPDLVSAAFMLADEFRHQELAYQAGLYQLEKGEGK